MERLSLPCPNCDACPVDHVFNELSQDLWPFLHDAVKKRDFDCDACGLNKRLKQTMQTFLSQAFASKAKTWTEVFGCRPPRQTLSRLCHRFHTQVHDSEGRHNVRNSKEFIDEVRRLARWYKERRRTDMRRRKRVLRDRPGKTLGPVVTLST